jgi:type IV pilus assembly protein PilA
LQISVFSHYNSTTAQEEITVVLKITGLKQKKNRGFTLIEVMVVVCILAIIIALAIPAIGGYYKNSRAQINLANAKMIYNASNAYLGSNPDQDPTKITGIIAGGSELISGNYISTVPHTAGGGDYTVGYDGTNITVKWGPETDIFPEKDGVYP